MSDNEIVKKKITENFWSKQNDDNLTQIQSFFLVREEMTKEDHQLPR